MPLRRSTSPVASSLSQLGEPLFRYAYRAPTCCAISRVMYEPLMWNSVTSSPVSGVMSLQVSSYTWALVPSLSVSLVQGVGMPPNCSGQTGIMTYLSLSLARRAPQRFARLQCQRQGAPRKHRLTKIGSFFVGDAFVVAFRAL